MRPLSFLLYSLSYSSSFSVLTWFYIKTAATEEGATVGRHVDAAVVSRNMENISCGRLLFNSLPFHSLNQRPRDRYHG